MSEIGIDTWVLLRKSYFFNYSFFKKIYIATENKKKYI